MLKDVLYKHFVRKNHKLVVVVIVIVIVVSTYIIMRFEPDMIRTFDLIHS